MKKNIYNIIKCISVSLLSLVASCDMLPDEPLFDAPVTPEELPVSGTYNGHDYVDLGLPSGLKWATCNVGATKPEGYGGYYAWGETEEKENYNWSTYKWCNGSETTITKYCTDSDYGIVDNKTVLDPEDDVAHVKWGGTWRMPTKAEQDELRNNCYWKWTTQNGVDGYKVTSKSNGNSIFLPAAGRRYDVDLDDCGSIGYYRSSSLDSDGSDGAICLSFDGGNYDWYGSGRYYGFSVRPVWGELQKYTVSVGTAGSGAVAIKDVDGTSATIEVGSTVTVVATPDEGYLFDGWFINGNETPVSTAAEYTFTVSEDVTLTAKFVPIVYEAVDLGLPSGIKWATHNVGAAKPEEYGGYYAWGEIEEKEFCTKENSVTNGKAINDISGNPMYDVACAKWGSKWRMPTKKEYEELLDKCTWIPDYINGVHGYIVEGVNGNSIFMPTAGYQGGGNIYYGGSYGYYWSSTPIDNEKSYACVLDFQSSGTFYDWYARELGKTVRPVCGELRKYTASVSSSGNGSIAIKDIDGTSAEFVAGSTVTVVATPDDGYMFSGWFIDGNETPVSTNLLYTFIVKADVAIEARFVPAAGYEAVDLGLPSGVKWATFNVGATKPWEYGSYYAWGETEEKDNYNRFNGKNTLGLEDDVAYQKWGGIWRMPTEAELDELHKYCTWTWTILNGVNGYRVTGSNGNNIFFPAAGYREGKELNESGNEGWYWLSNGYEDYASCLVFKNDYVDFQEHCPQGFGLTVRPVCGEWPKYTVSVSSDGNGSVAIKDKNGASAEFDAGATVTVIATPDSEYTFSAWYVNGVSVSTAAEYKFTVSEDVALTAKFVNPYLPSGSINGYDYVDLGLPSGVKWATCNVGATKPQEYGGYYAWGEVKKKDDYSWSTYKWCNGSETTMTKYCTDSNYGTVDNKTTLDPEDDVAHVEWGGNWRMPTDAEQIELYGNCTWTMTTKNGVVGYKVTSKTNGNSIFLPAAGRRYNMYLDNSGSYGYYWSSSLCDDCSNSARNMLFFTSGYDFTSDSRCYGLSVRPVSK